jgi:hypothetical protein
MVPGSALTLKEPVVTRLTTALLVAATLGAPVALAAPASAAVAPPTNAVTVTTNNGGVQVGAGQPGQPIIGVSADNGGVCFGISLQVGHCLPVTIGW